MRRRLAVLLTALVAGCAAAGDRPATPVAYSRIPGWQSDATAQAFDQFRRDCGRLSMLPAGQDLGGGTTAGDFAPACLAARQVLSSTDAGARAFFERWFAAYDAGPARITGYFEPEFPGSLSRGGAYQTPVLARPADLVTVASPDGHGTVSGRVEAGHVVPYPTRAEIDAGALAGRGLELVWLADPVDLFFLQLQGAGRIELPSGQILRLAYAGKNGRPYVPLGRLMVERELLAPGDDTPAKIRDWLEDNKAKSRSLIEQNSSYVFFRVVDDVTLAEGAPGALGVPLAPLRSIAVDPERIALGTPVFADVPGGSLRTLAMADDSAGRMPGGEVFFGWGPVARTRANALRADGNLYLLRPRPTRPAA